MAKIWDVIAESVKHNERVLQLNREVAALAKEMRAAHVRLATRDHELAERLVRVNDPRNWTAQARLSPHICGRA